MAILKCSNARQFLRVIPGRHTVEPVLVEPDDETIWSRVSGECVDIDGRLHALYWQTGILYLRIAEIELVVPERAESALRAAGGTLVLHLKIAGREFEITEVIPEWLRDNPTADHLDFEGAMWTYSVHEVLSEPGGRQGYWAAEH